MISTDREKELVIRFRDAKFELEKAEKEKTAKQEAYDQVENELMEMLEDQGKKSSAKFEDLGHVTLVEPRLYAKVLKEEEDKLFDYLIQNGFSELVKRTVHSGTLSSLVKEKIRNNEEVPPGVTYYLKKSLNFYPIK